MPAISGKLDVLYSEGDQCPSIVGTLKNVDLTGQVVRATFKRPTGVIVKTATYPNAVCGVFEFEWAAGDLIPGTGQLFIIQLVKASGKTQTLARLLLDVCEIPA